MDGQEVIVQLAKINACFIVVAVTVAGGGGGAGAGGGAGKRNESEMRAWMAKR